MKTRITIYLLFILLFVYAGSALAFTESTSTSNNDYFGYRAGGSGGSYNSFFGAYAGDDNTGSYNTFIGYQAGYYSTTGDYNTFLGYRAGYSNTAGESNTFIGYQAGESNTTAWNNTFLGLAAGYSNTTGWYNTFLGDHAGYSNTAGESNTFIGYRAGYYNTAGESNTFIGFHAGFNNTTAWYNTFLGYHAGYYNTAGGSNTFIGYRAGENNTTGNGNVFLGFNAGYNETDSNKLYIENTDSSDPLIYGEFDNDIVAINGDLGIGTSNPSAMLEVSGAAAHLKLKNPTPNSLDTGKIVFSEGDLDAITFRYDGNANIFFIDTISASNALVINRSTGYIGLGTSTPSSRLTVTGVIESTNGGIKFPDASVLTSANTINADTLDGLHSSAFALLSHLHSGADITSGAVGEAYIDASIARDSEIMPTVLANDGSASTLDADLLDGQDSSAFMTSSTDNWVDVTGDTMTGDLTVGADLWVDYDLYVAGNTYVDSDKNLKKDIKPIESSLEKVLGIEGVSYQWKEEKKKESKTSGGVHFGVIAQQVEDVLPEIVKKSDDGVRKVAYMELIPVLIEAVKELKEENNQMSKRITELERESRLKGSMAMADIK